jgi:flagellar biosynthesis protein FlhA
MDEGMLLPMLRLRDNTDLEDNGYQVMIYGKKMLQGTCEQDGFEEMIDNVVSCCKENYADVLNKNLVKIMVDNLKDQFPGVADGLIPEKISYIKLERFLQEKIRKGESIKDMIHIVEELEEQQL